MTESQTLAQSLAIFALDAYRHGVPADVSASVRRRVLDVLGLCAAAVDLPTSRGIIDHVTDQGGLPEAHVIGGTTLVPAAQAALANGVLAHSLDYDDTHLPSVLHPSASVVPAALASAESASASGHDLVRAVAVGLEVTVRIGMAGFDPASRTSVFFEHGQHATSICGAMGGAVSAALLLGADEEGVADAIGVAASLASGLIEANRGGGTVKRLHCGWAAHSAVSAAQLVRRGFSGPRTVLEGRFGFFRAFLRDEARTDEITRGLGSEWAVPGIFFKAYPANHFTHSIIEAGMALRERGLNPESIERIEIGAPTAVIRTIGEPIDVKRAPMTGYQAQFSGPYAAVTGLLGGNGSGIGLGDFTDDLARDPRRRALMALVDVVPDQECDAIFPYHFPAVVRVSTNDGRQWTEKVLRSRGGAEHPLPNAELSRKFRENAARLLDEESARRVESLVLGIEDTTIADVLASFQQPDSSSTNPPNFRGVPA